jgi:hypothetical protein
MKTKTKGRLAGDQATPEKYEKSLGQNPTSTLRFVKKALFQLAGLVDWVIRRFRLEVRNEPF